MSTERDFDRVARAWLDLMPDEAPDRVVDSVLMAVERTSQVRRRLPGSWRFHQMTRFALVGAAAIVAATGLYLVLSRPTPDISNQPSPPPPSVDGSSSPSASATTLDDALRATWVAFANASEDLGTGSGPVSLAVSSVGTAIETRNFGPGHGYASAATQLTPTQIQVVLDKDGGGCFAGAKGVYDMKLNEERSHLTVTTVSEECANRGLVFARTWVRSLDDPTNVGAGVVTALDPDFAVTLLPDAYQTRHLDDFVEIAGNNSSLMIHKNPQPFVDACSDQEERVPYQPGAAAFVDFFANNDAFVVQHREDLTVDGHKAIHADVGGKRDYARCPGQGLYEYTPKNCLCHFVVGQGESDSMYLVEVGQDTFLFIVSPPSTPTERQVIDSIQIPFDLPVQ